MTRRIKFKCDDRNYNEWCLYSSDTLYELDKSEFSIDPVKEKLLNQDIFEYNEETHSVTILHSSNREMPVIPGVIILEKNKTYGFTKINIIINLFLMINVYQYLLCHIKLKSWGLISIK